MSRKFAKLAEGEGWYLAWSVEDKAVLAVQDREGLFINGTTCPQYSRINVIVWWTSGNHQRLLSAHEFE